MSENASPTAKVGSRANANKTFKRLGSHSVYVFLLTSFLILAVMIQGGAFTSSDDSRILIVTIGSIGIIIVGAVTLAWNAIICAIETAMPAQE